MIIETDGAADEAPRFPKTLSVAVDLFKTLHLDALIHAVNASGLSAFNPVERRMAPLSHDLSGLILPHESFGEHLDSNGKTIDDELEKKNFFKAAEILSEVWSSTVIDGHSVDCIAVPVGQEYIPTSPDPAWVAKHVQQSRYSLQVVKCCDRSCCEPYTTDWTKIFPDRFIPAPAVYEYGKNGLVAVEPQTYFESPKNFEFATLSQRVILQKESQAASRFISTPFDFYCPSMEEKLEKGICNECGHYWPSQAAMKRHKKYHTLELRRKKKKVTKMKEITNW